jgi:hypothetical protein
VGTASSRSSRPAETATKHRQPTTAHPPNTTNAKTKHQQPTTAAQKKGMTTDINTPARMVTKMKCWSLLVLDTQQVPLYNLAHRKYGRTYVLYIIVPARND